MKPAMKPVEQEKTSLTMTKWIKATPAKVFEAWTKPDLINKWFAPDLQKMTPQAETDFRVGGSYCIKLKHEGGVSGASGKYIEIVAGKKIVFSWQRENSEGGCVTQKEGAPPAEPVRIDSVVTVEFFEKNGGTELVLTHERLPNADQVERHTEGWTGCLENLATFAATR